MLLFVSSKAIECNYTENRMKINDKRGWQWPLFRIKNSMNNIKTRVDDIARGFVCTYHPVALGSNPKQTIYAFSSLYY